MGRKTIRVEIPNKKPEVFSKLLNKINEQHILLGAESPLLDDDDIDMTVFARQLKDADKLRDTSEQFRSQAESAMQSARQVYGTDKGQTINTPGTLLFTLDLIKKQLLKKFKNKEEELSKFGFQVVIGQSKSPTKKPL